MVCAHQILFILHITYGAERTEAHGICIQRMEQEKKKRRIDANEMKIALGVLTLSSRDLHTPLLHIATFNRMCAEQTDTHPMQN